MAYAGSRRHVYFMDFRGKFLEKELVVMNKTGITIEPWIFPEANFQDVVHESLFYTKSRTFDLIFLCAGIFNFITKNSVTEEYYFPWKSCEQLIPSVIKMADEADDRFQKDRPATKVIYCPIIGVDLGMVLKREAREQQLILNEGIWALNLKFFELNNKRGYYCPNLMLPVHRIINKKRKNCYHHLQEDRLKLSDELNKRWASEMIKAAGPEKMYCKVVNSS